MIINPSAGGSSIVLDGLTINQNSNNEVQAIGTINPNSASGATAVLYDWEGTLQQYIDQNIATLHPEWICYITDDIQGGVSVYTKSECNNRFILKGTHEVIEYQEPTSANNWSWYRLYADDWVEQGGRTTNFTNTTGATSDDKEESLLVEMANTNYPVLVDLYYDLTLGNGSTAGWAYRDISGELTSTTTVNIRQYLSSNCSGTSSLAVWEVKGKARVVGV